MHISWKNIPAGIQQLSDKDVLRLMKWIATNPNVPETTWCKDFGSFKLVGEGRRLKTFMTRYDPCYGKEL